MEEIQLERKTENEFLEMARDCAMRIEDKNKEILDIKEKLKHNKKKICEIYGCFQKVDKYLHQITELDPLLNYLTEEIKKDFELLIMDEKEKKFNIVFNFDNDEE